MEMERELPWDLMCDILSRLTTTTLCRCKCVSKLWLRIICDSYFQSLLEYRSSKRNHNRFLFSRISKVEEAKNNEKFNLHLFSMDVKGNIYNEFTKKVSSPIVKMLPSRCDLVCLTSEKLVYIYNPSTHEFITLPEVSPSVRPNHDMGFGYLPTTKEFNVVRLFYRHLDPFQRTYDIGCEIFSFSRTNVTSSWRVIEEKCPYPINEVSPPAFFNGSIHWVIEYNGVEKPDVIISLDIVKEKFTTMPLPYDVTACCVTIHELSGGLCFLDMDDEIDIWILKDYQNQIWVKEYTVDYRNFLNDKARWPHDFKPRDVDNGEILFVVSDSFCWCCNLVEGQPCAHKLTVLGSYDIQTASFRTLKRLPFSGFSFYHESVIQ